MDGSKLYQLSKKDSILIDWNILLYIFSKIYWRLSHFKHVRLKVPVLIELPNEENNAKHSK